MADARGQRDVPQWVHAFSPGAWCIAALAVAATLAVTVLPEGRGDTDATMWASAKPHYDIYFPIVERWNTEPEAFRIDVQLLSRQVMDRRMIGGFLGEVPVADVIETERSTASLAFAGPLEAVGFMDLTDRLREDGLLDRINPPSLSPWTYEGRIFGIPHDVHPVLLGYRADIIDAAGISLDHVETWDDLLEALSPLQVDLNGDGVIDRHVMSVWASSSDQINTLLLQAGGGPFLADGTLAIDRPVNARAIAEMTSWMVGPDRVAADVPDFTPVGNKLKQDGAALCFLFPDWMCDVWEEQIPQLSGSMRLMPLPAWEPGGRRTSVWGGSMLGISREAENQDELWAFAKRLYTSDELAREIYREGSIITPIVDLWDDPVFDEPDPYFDDQVKGRLYISQAEDVPPRPATPYFTHGQTALHNAVARLREWAETNQVYEADAMMVKAEQLVADAHAEVARVMRRNAFHRPDQDAGS